MVFENAMLEKVEFVNRDLIRKILAEYFRDVEKFKFQLIRQGWENLSYLIRIGNKKYILRICNRMQFGTYKRDEENLLFEIEFAQFLKRNSLPIPHIFETITGKKLTSITLEGEKYYVVLFEFIKGREINIFNKSKIQNVARMQAKMHCLAKNWKPARARFLSGYTSHQDWLKETTEKFKVPQNSEYLSLFKQYRAILNKISEKILAQEPKEMPVLLVHADVHEGNMRFVDNEISGLFDFDDCRMSIIPEDIGMFLSIILRTGDLASIKRKAKIYFDEYLKLNKISKAEMELSYYFAVEKWLVPKFSKLRKQIGADSVETEKFFFALHQSNQILKLI